MLAVPATAHAACTPGADFGTSRPDLAAEAVALVNAHREAIGLPPLAVSPALQRAAEWKSGHMVARDYFDHEDQGEAQGVQARSRSCGYPDRPTDEATAGSLGENIGLGYTTPREATDGWLASDAHRRVIEMPGWTVTGAGVAEGGDGTLRWTQVFGAEPPPAALGGGGAPAVEVSAPAGLLAATGGPLTVSASVPPVTVLDLGGRAVARVTPAPATGAARLRVVSVARGLRARVVGRTLEVRRRTPASHGGRVVYVALRPGAAPRRGVVRVTARPLVARR